jgi:hypothetical protein
MLHEISLLEEEHLIFLGAVVAIVAAALAWMVTAVSVQCRRWRLSRQALAFKREMIERGLSVAEIERLLSASPPNFISRLSGTLVQVIERLMRIVGLLLRGVVIACQSSGVHRQRESLQFKARMIECGLSVDQIERLLAAQAPSWLAWLGAAVRAGLTHACIACRRTAQSLRDMRRARAYSV